MKYPSAVKGHILFPLQQLSCINPVNVSVWISPSLIQQYCIDLTSLSCCLVQIEKVEIYHFIYNLLLYFGFIPPDATLYRSIQVISARGCYFFVMSVVDIIILKTEIRCYFWLVFRLLFRLPVSMLLHLTCLKAIPFPSKLTQLLFFLPTVLSALQATLSDSSFSEDWHQRTLSSHVVKSKASMSEVNFDVAIMFLKYKRQ